MTEPLKLPLLFVGNFLDMAVGTRGISEDLSLQLAARGWPVLVTSRKTQKAARLFDMLRTVWTKKDAFAVAIVDVYSGSAFVWAQAVCWLLRRIHKPYILTLHGGNLPVFAAQSGGRVARLLQSAALVTAPSGYLQEQMQPYCGDLRLVPNPISLGNYSFRPRRAAQPRLVWLRAFHQVYNPQLVVDALELLQPEFPDISLEMVGPDKGDGTFAAVRAEVTRRGLTEKVKFIGAVPKSETTNYLREADIFVNTPNVDNTPVSVLEAMASGLCIVSTNVGGIPYLLEHETDALLVPARDPAALADAIGRILREPSLAQTLSANARRKVEAFDWSVIVPEWQSLLHQAAARGRLRPENKLAVEARP